MKIGILGTGIVGSNLGRVLAKIGHTIMFSSRTPTSEKMQALLSEIGANAQAGTPTDTVAFGEVVIVAVGWQNDLEGLLRSIPSWEGKVLVDTTNRFTPPPDWTKGSSAEDIAYLTGALILKAFNTTGANNYLDPVYNGQAVTMFTCGDDEAKAKAQSLVTDIGFENVDVGGLEHAHGLEMMAQVWVALAYQRDLGRDIAFQLVRRSTSAE